MVLEPELRVIRRGDDVDRVDRLAGRTLHPSQDRREHRHQDVPVREQVAQCGIDDRFDFELVDEHFPVVVDILLFQFAGMFRVVELDVGQEVTDQAFHRLAKRRIVNPQHFAEIEHLPDIDRSRNGSLRHPGGREARKVERRIARKLIRFRLRARRPGRMIGKDAHIRFKNVSQTGCSGGCRFRTTRSAGPARRSGWKLDRDRRARPGRPRDRR